ncbi:hypothetical protein ANMWB30_23720 [Arthrobacter sp. MWB30]|nr:hypothetical protein ANMWB30_23720 [Arthrobacter sp. MWB30]
MTTLDTTRPHRILVTGSREWRDEATVEQALDGALALLGTVLTEEAGMTLVHGDARGLDRLAAAAAAGRGWQVEGYPAQWGTHTSACPAWHVSPAPKPSCAMAGHRRNHEMIALGADLVIAFPMGTESSGQSRGTWGCTHTAIKAGLPTLVVWNGRFHPGDPRSRRLISAVRTSTIHEPPHPLDAPVVLTELHLIPF